MGPYWSLRDRYISELYQHKSPQAPSSASWGWARTLSFAAHVGLGPTAGEQATGARSASTGLGCEPHAHCVRSVSTLRRRSRRKAAAARSSTLARTKAQKRKGTKCGSRPPSSVPALAGSSPAQSHPSLEADITYVATLAMSESDRRPPKAGMAFLPLVTCLTTEASLKPPSRYVSRACEGGDQTALS